VLIRLRSLWNNIFRRRQLDHELDEELQSYVEILSAEKVREGMTPEEAHRDARKETGESMLSSKAFGMSASESRSRG
jgi:putative ABC transport system permease protein